MSSRWLWILVVAACGGAERTASPRANTDEHVARIERRIPPAVQVRGEEGASSTIADRMRELRVPALSIAVFEHGEVVWERAYGIADVDTGERATTDTTFLAGSISKSVNAYAALSVFPDADMPIATALTSWKLPDSDLTRTTPITLRMLLSHTAGTTVHGFPGYAAGAAIPTVPQILDGVPPANTPAVRVDLAPGKQFRYSGGGITITQLALVDHTHQTYPDLLAARVLEPFRMTRSTFDPARVQHAAAGHDTDGKVIAGKRHVYPEMAAAGLWTTAGDLARFFAKLARDRATPGTIAARMTAQVAGALGTDTVGMGVFLFERNGARFFGHGGADAGFQADAVASLDGGYGVVVMANSENGNAIFPEIERAVFAEYGWPGADPVITRFALDDAQRARLLGKFAFGPEVFEIAARDGKLYDDAPFETPVELLPLSPDELVRRNDGRRIRVDATGPVEARSVGNGPRGPLRRLDHPHHLLELAAGHFDAAVDALRAQLRSLGDHAFDEEVYLNGLGYRLLQRDPAKAVEVLRMVATAIPDSSNAHDSLGEAYAAVGDKPHAIAEYELALSTLDGDPHIRPEELAVRRKHATEELAKLRR